MTAPTTRDVRPGLDVAEPATFVIMAKAPVPGLVKTRLTPAYTDQEAAALAAAALLDTLDAVRRAVRLGRPDAPVPVVALAGDLDQVPPAAEFRAGLADFTVIEQHGAGLGPRLAHAHRTAAGAVGASVQIGMDTPQVRPAALAQAAALVVSPDGPDAVLAPAVDGGWWLLALRHAGDARVIAEVPTSTAETGQLTLAALRAAGLRVDLMPALRDVDEPSDVELVAAEAPTTRFADLARRLGPRR